MFGNTISLKLAEGTYVSGATPVYNGKVPPDFPFVEYLFDSVYENSTICNLVSDGTNFVPPSRNIDQLLQINAKYLFDSYCILITVFILKNMIYSASNIFFFLRHML